MLKIASPIQREPSQQESTQKQRKIPFLFMGLISSYVLLIMAVLGIGANIAAIRKERSSIFVQTPAGTESAQRVSPLHRTDQQLQAFARQWFKTAYTWKKEDQSKRVGKDTYPAQLWAASFALDLGSREGWLQQKKARYARQLPLDTYIAGKQEAIIELTREPTIQKVEEGVWRITIVADRAHVQKNGTSKIEAMKNTITVQAVPPSDKKENDILGLGQEGESLNALLHRWRKEGLKILLEEVS